jgi:hypothetical protein
MIQQMSGSGVHPADVEHYGRTFESLNQLSTAAVEAQRQHQARAADIILSGAQGKEITPEDVHVALATLKTLPGGLVTDDDEQAWTQAFAAGQDPRKFLESVSRAGKGPQKPITNETELAIAANNGNLPAAMNQLKPPPKPEAVKGPNTPFEAALIATAKDPLHPTADEVTQAQAVAAKSTPQGDEPLVTIKTMENGKPVEKVVPRSQAPGTYPSQPPASIIYPKPEAGQQGEIQVKPNTQMYRVAQDIAYGTLTMADFNRIYGRAMGNAGTKVAIYDKARELNPDFDPSKFELGFKLAGNPAIRQRLVAIDSLGPVIDKIEGLAQQADLTNVPALNKLLSAGKFAIGDKTITNYRQLQTLLGDEVGNALGVGSGSDLKTRLGLDLVNPNLGPQQFIASMEQIRSVLGARKETLLKQFGPYAGAAGGNAPATASPAAAPSSLDALKAKRKALGLE